MHEEDEAATLYHTSLDQLAAGDPLAAIATCRQALSLNPKFLDAMHALVRAYLDAGQLDEGIAAAAKLSELDPEDVLALTGLSILYQRKGMVAEAEAAALKAKLLSWKLQLRARRQS